MDDPPAAVDASNHEREQPAGGLGQALEAPTPEHQDGVLAEWRQLEIAEDRRAHSNHRTRNRTGVGTQTIDRGAP